MTQEELQNECWKACYHTGDLEFIKKCLDQGLNINARAPISGAVPLGASIYGGHEHIFNYLLKHGADVNTIGYEDGTVLMAASYLGSYGFMQKLLGGPTTRISTTTLRFVVAMIRSSLFARPFGLPIPIAIDIGTTSQR